MQSSSSTLPFKQTLAGASPATDATALYFKQQNADL